MSEFPRLRLVRRSSGYLRKFWGGHARKHWQVLHEGKGQWLTDQQGSVLMCMVMNKNFASKEQLIEALWETGDDMPEGWLYSMRVVICQLNKKLRKIGWTVGSYREHMYVLSEYRAPKPVWVDVEQPMVHE